MNLWVELCGCAMQDADNRISMPFYIVRSTVVDRVLMGLYVGLLVYYEKI
jgi:hypothetical protein